MLETKAPTATTHPLEPLSKAEIESAVAITKADSRVNEAHRFVSVVLNEPDKQSVLGYRQDSHVEREAFVVLLDRSTAHCIEAVVSLTQSAITSWRRDRRCSACYFARRIR